MSTADEFRTELARRFAEVEKRGLSQIRISSGEIHRAVGGYPGPDHRMPVCCSVMETELRAGDVIESAPPKGNGASLTIRYGLPR